METLGIIASILGILAFFAISPNEMIENFRNWFWYPIKILLIAKKPDIYSLFTDLGVDDIKIENLFLNSKLDFTRFSSEVIEYSGSLPKKIISLKNEEIEQREKESREKGVTLDNNESYALRRIDISRPEGKNGKRENNYKLILEPTNYFSFIFPNLYLDKRYPDVDTQEKRSLREMLNLNKDNLTISMLEKIPDCQFKIGTGTLLVTKDNYLICTVRSKKQAVAAPCDGELAVHLSTAEGMYRSRNIPESGDLIDGVVSPFATSIRSLRDELNIEEQHGNFDRKNLFCLGYFLDTRRAQPFFLFYLKLNLYCDDFFALYSDFPSDVHENDAIFAIPVKSSEIRKLFDGVPFCELTSPRYPQSHTSYFSQNNSLRVRIASNQAEAGFAIMLYKSMFYGN
jgi:hypothetical protein